MPTRRVHERFERLGYETRMYARWETERDVVRFAVILLARSDGAWQTVELFDCSHDGRNDRHRYSYDGVKGPPETFITALRARR
jgi:hypothetical protein